MKGKTKRDSEISPTRKWELKRKRKKKSLTCMNCESELFDKGNATIRKRNST